MGELRTCPECEATQTQIVMVLGALWQNAHELPFRWLVVCPDCGLVWEVSTLYKLTLPGDTIPC